MKLPTILAIVSQPDEVALELEMSSQLEAFNGHFPNNPVLPGVVQIDWAVRFAALHLSLSDIVAKDFQVKFRNVIRPAVPVSLTLTLDRPKNRLSFVYQSGANIMSSGQLKLAVMP